MKPTCKSLKQDGDRRDEVIRDLARQVEQLQCKHDFSYLPSEGKAKAWALGALFLERECIHCGKKQAQVFEMSKRKGRKAAKKFMRGE